MATEMNLIKRLSGQTPKFFKIIIRIGVTMLALGLGIVASSEAGVTFPDIVLTIAEKFIWIGTIASLISKLTIEEPAQSADVKQEETSEQKEA